MIGTYLTIILAGAAFVLWPNEAQAVLVSTSLKIQIFYINYRMKFMAWRMYRSLKKMCKESGWPDPGPFRFVNLWDRES